MKGRNLRYWTKILSIGHISRKIQTDYKNPFKSVNLLQISPLDKIFGTPV